MAKKKAKNIDISQPSEVHDTFFRQLMSEPTTAIDFVQNYLPAQLVDPWRSVVTG